MFLHADAQTDLSLRWAHRPFIGFVMRRLILSLKLHYFGPNVSATKTSTNEKPRYVKLSVSDSITLD